MIEPMITTVDNPHDPFIDFLPWYAYDEGKGYHTSSLLARIISDSEELSIADNNLAFHMAIDDIVAENSLGLYRKVTREIPNPELQN